MNSCECRGGVHPLARGRWALLDETASPCKRVQVHGGRNVDAGRDQPRPYEITCECRGGVHPLARGRWALLDGTASPCKRVQVHGGRNVDAGRGSTPPYEITCECRGGVRPSQRNRQALFKGRSTQRGGGCSGRGAARSPPPSASRRHPACRRRTQTDAAAQLPAHPAVGSQHAEPEDQAGVIHLRSKSGQRTEQLGEEPLVGPREFEAIGRSESPGAARGPGARRRCAR